MMLYSHTCEYAIRALTHLASFPSQFIQLRTIAEAEDIPYAFLGKIFQNLVRKGFLDSAKGPNGGYCLACPPIEITLHDIKVAIDGPSDLDRCAVGLDDCSDNVLCPLHDAWSELRNKILGYLHSITLKDMAIALSKKANVAPRNRVSATTDPHLKTRPRITKEVL